METSTLISVNFDSELKKAGIGRSTLKPGDTLPVRVLEILGDRRVRADFGQFRANAEVTFAVKRGEELMVKVVETGPQLRFSVIQPGPESGSAADNILESVESKVRVLAKLKSTVDSLLSEINNLQSVSAIEYGSSRRNSDRSDSA
jgi:hypothetical protein